MADMIVINGEIIGYIYDLKTAKAPASPKYGTDRCPAFSGQGCSYYDGQCPYCGNTIECQSREEWAAL